MGKRNNYSVVIDVGNLDEFPINVSTRKIDDNGMVYFRTEVGHVSMWSPTFLIGDDSINLIDARLGIMKGVE